MGFMEQVPGTKLPFWQLNANVATEFVGTMFLALTVSLTAKTSTIAPIAIGFTLMVCIYAGGHVSGANYNPAVTFAILVRGAITPVEAVLYVIHQLLGAACGGALSFALIGEEMSGYPAIGTIMTVGSDGMPVVEKVGVGSALLCEIILTFALCWTVLHTATTKRQANNSYYGLAIGCIVVSGAVSVGGLSGGAFNPAVGILPWLQDEFEDTWIYWVGPLLGGAIAGGLFRVVEPTEYTSTPNAMQEQMAPMVVEFVGTFMLCYTVATAASSINTSVLVPLSIGSMLMCMIYAGGAISGGHFNPAVTLAVFIRSRFGALHDDYTIQKAIPQWIGQILGSLVASLLAWVSFPKKEFVGFPQMPNDDDIGAGILGEVLGTFLLVYVILNTATIKQVAGNHYFGLAIGQVVTACAVGIGPVTGGAFNPAVGLISVFIGDPGRHVWIYWVGPPIGSVLACGFFRFHNYVEFNTPDDKIMKHIQYHIPDDKVQKDHSFMSHNLEILVGTKHKGTKIPACGKDEKPAAGDTV